MNEEARVCESSVCGVPYQAMELCGSQCGQERGAAQGQVLKHFSVHGGVKEEDPSREPEKK